MLNESVLKLIYNISAILFCIAFFAGCEGDASGKIYHPTQENIPQKEIIASNVSLNVDRSMVSLTKNEKYILKKLSNGNKISTFGKPNRDNFLPFNMIKDIVINEDGFIFLLVDNLKKVLVFDINGNFLTHIGQQGRGPGDFLFPISLATDKGGNLYVLDKFEVDVFSFIEGEFKLINSIKHNLSRSWDICVMGGMGYISGYSAMQVDSSNTDNYPMKITGPIHLYNISSGKYMEYFGKYYNSASGWPIFTGKLSAMKLVCSSSSKTVVSIYKHFPFLYGYSNKGKIKWVSKISGYQYRKFYEKLNHNNLLPLFGIEPNRDPYNTISSIFDLDKDNYIFIQIDKKMSLPNVELSQMHDILNNFEPEINSLLLNSKNGNIAYLSDELGYILDANNNYLIKKSYNKNALIEMNKEYSELKTFKINYKYIDYK